MGNEELLLGEYKVSVMQNEYILQTAYNIGV